MVEDPAQSDAEPVLYKDIERILDDESAWIARPNKAVTFRIAIAAYMAAEAHLSALTQSDAEPVGWQWRYRLPPRGEWSDCRDERDLDFKAQYPDKYELRLTPHRPDASAGLIEALEQALDCIRGETPEDMSHEEARQDTINKIRAVLNPRAADRSGK